MKGMLGNRKRNQAVLAEIQYVTNEYKLNCEFSVCAQCRYDKTYHGNALSQHSALIVQIMVPIRPLVPKHTHCFVSHFSKCKGLSSGVTACRFDKQYTFSSTGGDVVLSCRAHICVSEVCTLQNQRSARRQ